MFKGPRKNGVTELYYTWRTGVNNKTKHLLNAIPVRVLFTQGGGQGRTLIQITANSLLSSEVFIWEPSIATSCPLIETVIKIIEILKKLKKLIYNLMMWPFIIWSSVKKETIQFLNGVFFLFYFYLNHINKTCAATSISGLKRI